MSKRIKKFAVIFLFAICVCAAGMFAACAKEESAEKDQKELPEISASFDIKYSLAGESVKLPDFRASYKGQPISTTAKMFFGQEEIDVSGGFIPEETGEYTYCISAVAPSGETANKDIIYYIEDDESFLTKALSFDKPYGLKQIGLTYGMEPKYTTERKYGEEDGSLQLTVDTRYATVEAQLSFGNFHIKDATVFEELYFYVYNDTQSIINLCLNWTNVTPLKPMKWTRVSFSAAELENLSAGPNELLNEKFNSSSMDGVNVDLISSLDTPYIYTLNFSAVYFSETEYVLTGGHVKERIDAFLAAGGTDEKEAEEIQELYNSLDENRKMFVTNFDEFAAAMTEILRKQFTLKEDKLLYLDDPAGYKQFSYIQGATAAYSTLYRHGEESGSTVVTVNDFDAKLTVGYPMIGDLRKYDYVKFYVYNPSNKAYTLHNQHNDRIGEVSSVVLEPRTWTEVVFDIGRDSTIAGRRVWIYSGDWSIGIESGRKFYFSAFYVGGEEFLEPSELTEKIDALNESTSYEELISLYRNYQKYTEEEKALVENYADLLDFAYRYLTQEAGAAADEGALIHFSSAAGIKQVSVSGASASYDDYMIEGQTVCATEFSVSGFDAQITLNFVPKNTGITYKTVRFNVYNDNEEEYVLFNEHGNRIGEATSVTLAPKSWTQVEFVINGEFDFSGKSLWIYSGDWNTGMENGQRFYFTSLYAETADGGYTPEEFVSAVEELIGGSDTDMAIIEKMIEAYDAFTDEEKKQIVNYESFRDFVYRSILKENGLTHNESEIIRFDTPVGLRQTTITGAEPTAESFGNEDKFQNSTRLAVNGFDVKIGLRFIHYDPSLVYNSVEFYVFNANDADYMLFNGHNDIIGEACEISLPKNSWTKITLSIHSYADLRDKIIWIYSGDWSIGLEGKTFYISAVEATYYEEAETLISFSLPEGISAAITTHGNLAHSSDFCFAGQSYALKITLTDFYADLKIAEDISLAGYHKIRFAVYNASGQNRGFINKNAVGEPEYDDTGIVLSNNCWTVIEWDVSGLNNLNGIELRFYSGDWNIGAEGSVFYLSDIQGVRL